MISKLGSFRAMLITLAYSCTADSFVFERPRLMPGSSLSAQNYDFELREARIMLDKMWKADSTMGLSPMDEFTKRLQGYLDVIVDGGSPIALDELESSDYFSGSWRLAFSNDPRATILKNPVVGDTKVFLEMSPRVGNAFGGLIQRIEINGKPGVRGEARYSVGANGLVNLQYEKIMATIMGFEVETPSFLVEQTTSSISTSWFDGRLWIERLNVQDVGVPDEARSALEAAAGAAGISAYIYNVYKFDGDRP